MSIERASFLLWQGFKHSLETGHFIIVHCGHYLRSPWSTDQAGLPDDGLTPFILKFPSSKH